MQDSYSSLFGKIAALEAAVDALIKTHHSGHALLAKFAENCHELRVILVDSSWSSDSLASFDAATYRISVLINDGAERQGTFSLGRIGPDGKLTKTNSD